MGMTASSLRPSLIPMEAGDRVKIDRRDALMLAKLHRAGELTPIWVPDGGHEAMRDWVRAREEWQYLPPPQLPATDDRTRRIDTMDLADRFGEVDCDNVTHWMLP
jgi:hypothetical protein